MSLFDPDPELPFWMHAIPMPDDLDKASPEQRDRWIKLNAHISYVHTAWTNMELMLSLLFAAILRIKISQAQVILGTLNSNKTKRDLVQNCATLTLASNDRLKDIERILRRISKVATKRNFLAHGIGAYHQKFPERITVIAISPELKPALTHYLAFREEDLIEIQQTLYVLAIDIQELAPIIWRARRRALPETPIQKRPHDMGFAGNHRRPQRETQHTPQKPSPKKPQPKKMSSAQRRSQAIRKRKDET